MIRIPFSDESRNSEPSLSAVPMTGRDRPQKKERLEDQMRSLETKLSTHAEEICGNVTARVERIESRIQRAMETMTGETDSEPKEKVVEFSDSSSLHHLPAISAREALNDLNETLDLTREHLSALRGSVAQMRESLGRN